MDIPEGHILACGRCGERYDKRPDGWPRCRECGTYGEPASAVPDVEPGTPLCDPDDHDNEDCFHY